MKKIIVFAGFLLIMGACLTGCYKDVIIPHSSDPAAPPQATSFAKDIQPVLIKSCALSGCHSGSQAPNLSAATSFNALATGGYVNTGTPKSSSVYLWLTGKKAVAMPAGSANNPSNINALMLAWITQGAKNN